MSKRANMRRLAKMADRARRDGNTQLAEIAARSYYLLNR